MRDIINKLEQINEGLGELAHEAEKDHEVQMARSDLYKTAKYAVAIHKMLKDVSEMEGIDGWVQAKITKAADYLGAVKHHMEGEIMQDVELAVVPVAGDMTDAMDVPQESVEVIEAEERDYICVHAKKGKYECSGTSSYAAAKKAAEHWGLKSTAGIDAHLADEKKTATEDAELRMMANSRDRVENTYAAILQGVRGRGPAEESEVGDYIPSGMTSAEIMQLIDMLEPQGYDKDFLLKDLAPMMKEDSLQELDKMITKLPPRTSQADRDARIANAPGVPAGTKGTSLDAWKGGKIPANIANNPSYKSEPGKAWIKQQQAAAKKHFGEGKLEEQNVDAPVTTHDVKKGDTLYSLAKKHNTTVDRLKQMNRQDDDKIKVGQKLNVPEDSDIIGDIIKKLPNTKAGQKTGKDVIGDIISKLPKDDPRTNPNPAPAPDSPQPDRQPKVSAQQQQKMVNKAVATPKILPKAPPQRPERIRSFAQDTTAPLSMMKNWSKN